MIKPPVLELLSVLDLLFTNSAAEGKLILTSMGSFIPEQEM